MSSHVPIIVIIVSIHYVVFASCKLGSGGRINFIDENWAETNSDVDELSGGLETYDSHSEIIEAKNDNCISGDVTFHLYTKKKPENYEPLMINCLDYLQNSSFDGNKQTIFVTHGYLNNGESESCTAIRNAYLQGGHDLNIIIVDWREYTKLLTWGFYNTAATRVQYVGEKVASMINFLRTRGNLQLKATTLIGHSLGAHVMGVAGKLSRDGNNMVNQIFGLDPALPGFRKGSVNPRLDKSSAKYVQVIHTNGGNLGMIRRGGHADFYPNGGRRQPGCIGIDGITAGACSHGRAFWYFAESLNSSTGFKGRKCKFGEDPRNTTCTGPIGMMGGRATNITYKGIYGLTTNTDSPYAI